jgi:putative redox protein
MDASIRWAGAAAFEGRTEGGHRIMMDGPPEGGGRNLGPRPMETFLLGMGACSSYDVVSILRKGRQDLSGCEVRIRAERAATDPKVFTEIHLHFELTGHGLSAQHVARAIKLSAEKYCSASIMLGKTARITHSYEIREAGQQAQR